MRYEAHIVRRWWVEHDTVEFGRSTISGTMPRMHEVAKCNGMSICDVGEGEATRQNLPKV